MAAKRFRKYGHGYRLYNKPEPSVSTIIKIYGDPGGLISWSAETAATYADENWEHLAALDRDERILLIKNSRNIRSRDAMDRGTLLHLAAEELGRTGETTPAPEHAATVEAVRSFLDAWEIEPLAIEQPVANLEHRYCGTFDLIGKSPKLGVFMIDWKTGRLMPSQALQLAGYRYCDIRLDDDGNEQPMIKVDRCFVAHVLPDAVELVPMVVGPEEYETFLFLREVWAWHDSAAAWGKPLTHPVVGEPIYPERTAV